MAYRIKSVVIENVYQEDFTPEDHYANSYDDLPAEEAARYKTEDAEQIAAFNRGDWHAVGCRAVATLVLERPGLVDTEIVLTTPGIWGIESNSDPEYFLATGQEELESYLVRDLEDMRFSPEEINAAVADIRAGTVEISSPDDRRPALYNHSL